jgi:hypothetical protein
LKILGPAGSINGTPQEGDLIEADTGFFRFIPYYNRKSPYIVAIARNQRRGLARAGLAVKVRGEEKHSRPYGLTCRLSDRALIGFKEGLVAGAAGGIGRLGSMRRLQAA